MNPKQSLFCQEYIVDLNATQAAIRSGYSEKTARAIANKLLTKADIQSAIQVRMDKRSKETAITAASVLKDIEAVKTDAMQVITDRDGNRVMNNHAGALKALELQGKHLKMFTDKVEQTGANGGLIETKLTIEYVKSNTAS